MLESSNEVHQIIAALRGYLARHPDAADTVEGVANWWIPSQRFEMLMPHVERALELLVKQGDLSRHIREDGRCVYTSVAKRATNT